MAFKLTRSLGMTLLAVYLLVVGISGLVPIGLPFQVTAALALAAGILILMGR